MNDTLEGKTIENVRRMTDEELDDNYWFVARVQNPPVLELGDGSVLYPAKDTEANGPGELCVRTPDQDDDEFFML